MPSLKLRGMIGLGLTTGVASVFMLSLGLSSADAQQIQKLQLGAVPKAITPIFIDTVIPEYLGYNKAEGLSVEAIPLGSNAAAIAALDSKRVDFFLASAPFQLPLVAKGERAGVNFFESTYPFKYSLATKAGSPIKSIAELKGKRIGVNNIGASDYPVGQAVVKLGGLDPEKDISWLAVGDGASAGQALARGDVDALFTIDTNFGSIESAGIAVSYLQLPADIPKIGGVYLAATPEFLRDHRAWAVGFARGVAKAHIFIQENLEAAAYIYGQMFPEAMPKGMPIADQVKAIMVPVGKRMQIYGPHDPAVTQAGFIRKAEWDDEIKFAGLDGKFPDYSQLFTNDLIADINKFDAEKIKAEAKAFKLPYK